MSSLKSLIDGLSDFVLVLDAQGKFIAVNDALQMAPEFSATDFSRLSFSEMKKKLGLPWEKLGTLLAQAASLPSLDFNASLPNAKIIWVARMREEVSKQYWLIGRKQIEVSESSFLKALYDNNVSPELLINTLPGHVYLKDIKGRYIACNERQATFLNLDSPLAVVGKTDYDFFPDEEADRIREFDQLVIKEQRSISIEESIKEALHHEKKEVFLSNKIPLHDLEGRLIGVLGISFDITERKRVEQSMRSIQETMQQEAKVQQRYLARLAEEVTGMEINPNAPAYVHAEVMRDFLEEIIAHIPGHVYWLDRNNVILGCNEAQAASARLKSRRDIVGKTNFDMPWAQHAEELNAVNLMVLKTGKPHIAEELSYVYLPGKQEKELRIFLSHKVALHNKHGEIVGVLGASVDITELKRIENELAKQKDLAEMANRSKTEFLANISHELRTPLNAIVGMAQILQLELSDELSKEYVDIIYKSGINLANLIEDILDFAKLDAGKLALSPESVDLHMLVNDILETLSYRAKDKGLSLDLHYEKETPCHVIVDPKRLRQILVNLINNAIKFTEVGGITVTVSYRPKNEPGRAMFIFSVKDTGIGIDSAHLTSIFDRFSQVDSSYRGRYDGVGLGLAITKQLIDIMKGEIDVASIPHQGSEFSCYLPLEVEKTIVVSSNSIVPSNESISTNAPSKKSFSALVIEDNLLNQMVIRLMLEELNYEVVMADTGEKGLALFSQKKPDIICVDIGLPDIDGLEIVKRIRADEKKPEHLPILAITAHVLNDEKQSCYAAGVDFVVSKPVMRHELRAALEKCFAESRKENPAG